MGPPFDYVFATEILKIFQKQFLHDLKCVFRAFVTFIFLGLERTADSSRSYFGSELY